MDANADSVGAGGREFWNSEGRGFYTKGTKKTKVR